MAELVGPCKGDRDRKQWLIVLETQGETSLHMRYKSAGRSKDGVPKARQILGCTSPQLSCAPLKGRKEERKKCLRWRRDRPLALDDAHHHHHLKQTEQNTLKT